MPMIYLYVEVLANIRQANLYASLETHKNEHTKIDIASDKKTITVSHDGESASIYLPTEIGGTAEVSIPVDRGKEMSVRLELADIMNMPCVGNTTGDEAPWAANDLSPNTQLRCRDCKTEILTNELPLQFKALPSEHWAEMMDIWHCHRPQDIEPSQGEDARQAADSKGYGASTKLKAAAGIAFVDTASFLFAEQSCKDVQTHNSELHCATCKALLGAIDVSAEGWRLYKSSLSLRPSPTAEWQSFPPEIFISSQLLSLIGSSAARKFIIHPHDDTKQGLLIWVFNPDMRYSSSRRSELVVRALKIFYQNAEDPQKLLDEHQASFEELPLPASVFDSLKNVLIESTEFLPPSARKFQDWTIGLIDRYERNSSDGLKYFDDVTHNVIERSGD
ncbi:hypothetical protein EPUS_03300 [Endocarpon pusillum Z07020]|uniref:Ubiquitin-conjugating enzyme E2C-binding protein n=1 Tax=Endocarpon pusillum (strain Z07020 / HMAS-L-300199) TaxID=1263415 RepID=U1HL67_ENDPU|nr:uncharacterized protein EPUS_03300 [Endocarpon pusillum Z07020]ERF71020.1 hypothetical protein EPUS_03300 [Endocarpon pusillum Z07020]